MSKLYLMTGVSGSGKTTFAKEFARKNNLQCITTTNPRIQTKLVNGIKFTKFAITIMYLVK